MFYWILGFSVIGSIGAIVGAAALLAFPENTRRIVIPNLVSYAAGTLLGAAFLGMIPASLERAPAINMMATVLAGIVIFFMLEKLVIWRHCHRHDCRAHGRAGPLILIGDALHNFVDGVVIAVAFLTSIELGIATALAVVAHEVPQELGEFAVLLDAGYGRMKAILLNTLSASATIPGAILAYFGLAATSQAVPYVIALSAASFIYIATADLIPGLHRETTVAASMKQLLLLLAGISTVALFYVHH